MRNYESDAYRKYQSSIEQRQKVVRTSGSPYSQQTAVQGKGQRAEMSASIFEAIIKVNENHVVDKPC